MCCLVKERASLAVLVTRVSPALRRPAVGLRLRRTCATLKDFVS